MSLIPAASAPPRVFTQISELDQTERGGELPAGLAGLVAAAGTARTTDADGGPAPGRCLSATVCLPPSVTVCLLLSCLSPQRETATGYRDNLRHGTQVIQTGERDQTRSQPCQPHYRRPFILSPKFSYRPQGTKFNFTMRIIVYPDRNCVQMSLTVRCQ